MSNADSRREKLDGSKLELSGDTGNFWKLFFVKRVRFRAFGGQQKTKNSNLMIFDYLMVDDSVSVLWLAQRHRTLSASDLLCHSAKTGEISEDMIGLWGTLKHIYHCWFGTCFFVHNIWDNPSHSIIYGIILPIDFHIFQDG